MLSSFKYGHDGSVWRVISTSVTLLFVNSCLTVNVPACKSVILWLWLIAEYDESWLCDVDALPSNVVCKFVTSLIAWVWPIAAYVEE